MEARRALGLISGRRDGILMVHNFLLLGYKGWADFWVRSSLREPAICGCCYQSNGVYFIWTE
jgi:hypothetical protein